MFVHDVLLLVLLFHGFYLDLVYCLNTVLLLGSFNCLNMVLVMFILVMIMTIVLLLGSC